LIQGLIEWLQQKGIVTVSGGKYIEFQPIAKP
jgi:hypothetical protein